MKKYFFICLFLFLFAFSVSAEEVSDFRQEISLERDASFVVTETITYDFGDLEKHGIYRDIIYKYNSQLGRYKLDLKVLSVKDDKGNDWNYQIINDGDYRRVKIGDANKLVSGKQVYVIEYQVKKGITFFEDHDELYWNVTGQKWEALIRQSVATVVLPELLEESQLDFSCYSGAVGSNSECVSKRFSYEGAGMVKEAVFIDDVIQTGNGFTIVMSFPKGYIEEPSFIDKVFSFAWSNWIIILPLFVLFFMYKIWQSKGKDPIGRTTIVAEFDAPDKLSPMEVGTLVDEHAGKAEFSAQIIYLAIKGYIKIIQDEKGKFFKTKDYVLLKIKDSSDLPKLEKLFIDKIFSRDYLETNQEVLDKTSSQIDTDYDIKMVRMSKLKNKFYNEFQSLKKTSYEVLVEKGYFSRNPNSTRAFYTVFGVLLIPTLYFLAPMLGPIAIVSIIISSLIIIVFAQLMPQKTRKGSVARDHILGLKRYLEVAEKDRLEFHNAPEKNPKVFEKLLPFAMALGVEKKWAKQFEDIYSGQNPNWYTGNTHAFSALALTDSISSFSSFTSSSMTSTASSGGSGFSGGGVGGGFGGGGGGSW